MPIHPRMERDLYRIDNLLLRAGMATGALLLFVALLGFVAGLEANAEGQSLAWRAEFWLSMGFASLCPVGLLMAGSAMRRQEQQVSAVWDLLRQNAELEVPALLANSDFERSDLERAVHFLNNRGIAHYVWDDQEDVIQDARLRDSTLHVEVCDACGAKIALDVPLAFRDLPGCTHCGDPISADALQERRSEAIDAIRERPRSDRESANALGDFSPGIFFTLLFLCWPAALGYAWLKSQRKI